MKSTGTHRSYQIKTICNAPIELIDGDRGKNYPKQHDFSSSGYCLFLNAGNVTKSGLDFHECAFISEEKDSLLGKGKLRRGDIIVTTRGTLGNIGYYDKSAPYDKVRINSGMIILRPLESELEATFLYCYLRSALFQSQVTKLSSGSAQPQLPIRDFRNIEIPLPPLPEQRRIAHVLGTLDDKIENNRKTAQTLEAMAQATFQSWFVDFDPVRAKMAGESRESICKRLKLTPEILDLFPDRLVDSELGEIPEGWEVKPLDSIANFLNGLAMQKFPSCGPEDALPVIKIAQLRTGSLIGADHSSCEIEPHYIVHDGDILFSWSGSLECVLWSGGTGALNQHLFKVTPKANYPRWICYFGIHHYLNFFREIASGKATTMGHIQRHHLSDTVLTLPSIMNLDVISKPVQALFETVWKKVVEAQKLSDMRDTLLPKLISGEIRVADTHDCSKEIMV